MHTRRTGNAGGVLWVAMVATLASALLAADAGAGAARQRPQHYKVVSTVEHSGKTQHRSHIETLLTVRKGMLSEDQVQYFVSSQDFDLVSKALGQDATSPFGELSFVVDRHTKRISDPSGEIALLAEINNRCVGWLTTESKDNIGKTWKQTFDMPTVDPVFEDKVTFTIAAIQLETKAFGKVVAVRALSEPFAVRPTNGTDAKTRVIAKMNSLYLFDPQFENVYLSMTVFDASGKVNGAQEDLRHETATYMTDSRGNSVDLTGLGQKFEKFASKVGVSQSGLKVKTAGPVPHWVTSGGLRAAQAANICGALACEGAPNPVASVCIPVARTAGMQGSGMLAPVHTVGSVMSVLSTKVPGIAGMTIAVAPVGTVLGVPPTTAAAAAGATAGAIAIAGGGGSDSSTRSPTTP